MPLTIAFALDQLGRHDESRSILDTVSIGNSGNDANNAILRNTAFHFMVSGRYEEAVRYVEEHFSDLNTMLQRFERTDGSNSRYLTSLAYCFLQTSRDSEFKSLTDALEESVARRVVAGDKSFSAISNEVNLAALTGTDEEVLIKIQELLDNDSVGVNLFDSPIFNRMRENAEFQKLDAIFVKRANDERAKLGLHPYVRALPSS